SDIILGVLVPAGTPQDVVDRLHREIVRIVALADVRERLSALGFEPIASTPKEFADRIRWGIDKWTKVIRAANIKPQGRFTIGGFPARRGTGHRPSDASEATGIIPPAPLEHRECRIDGCRRSSLRARLCAGSGGFPWRCPDCRRRWIARRPVEDGQFP